MKYFQQLSFSFMFRRFYFVFSSLLLFCTADSYYLGARGQLQNASAISTVFIIADVNSCVETCRTNGFNYFMINEEAIPGTV